MTKILFISAETSGDLYSYYLVKQLLNFRDFKIFVIGGDIFFNLDDKINLIYDSTTWSAIGPFNALKKIPKLLYLYQDIKKIVLKENFDKIVLIDFPAFNMRLADFIKKNKLKAEIIYLIPPSTWKFNEKKVKNVCRLIDKIIVPFHFNLDFYKDFCKDRVFYFGHPLYYLVKEFQDKYSLDEIYKELDLDKGYIYIGVFPGSRKEEIDYIFPVLIKFMYSFYKVNNNVKFLIPAANKFIFNLIKRNNLDFDFIKLYLKKSYYIFSISYFNILTSGTSTLESTFFNKPMIVVYKMSYIHFLLSKLLKIGYISIPNILSKKEIVPELKQYSLNIDNLFYYTNKYIKDKDFYSLSLKSLSKISKVLMKDNIMQEILNLIINK